MQPGSNKRRDFSREISELTDEDIQQWLPGWSKEEEWKKLEAWLDERDAADGGGGNDVSRESALIVKVPGRHVGSSRIPRDFKHWLRIAAMLILGASVLNANAVKKVYKQAFWTTVQELQAKRDKEAYMKTRPWYERASNAWTEKSGRYTKGINKVLGGDENAVRHMKRKMDSLGFKYPVDYYKWLKAQRAAGR